MTRGPMKLRTRVSLYFLGLLATWTLFVLILLGNLLSQMARDLFRERGAQLARAIAVESAPLVHYEDTVALTELLEHHLRAPSDIRYIVLLREGSGGPEVVWSSFAHGTPGALLGLRHERIEGQDVSVRLIQSADEQLFDYATSKAGVLARVGMTLLPVQTYTHEVTSYILWIGVAGLLAVFAIALHVSRPVEALTTAVTRAAELDPGLRSEKGPMAGTVETSTLAQWFQRTVLRLEESTRRLDTSKKLAYLGEISTSIAHEINNPLGVIVLNSSFLAKRAEAGELPEQVAEEVERVQSAAMRATLAAQKLLQFARYSTRKNPLKRRRVRVEPVIHETVELLRDRIQVADCRVHVDLPADLPSVSLDSQGIQQVLFNLLTNALDASRSGSEIVIRAEMKEDDFVLSVKDEGRGMGAELVQRAMEPFVTTKDPGKGTGLGLAISRSIVHTHGGDLRLESRPGHGTEAIVRLPLGATP